MAGRNLFAEEAPQSKGRNLFAVPEPEPEIEEVATERPTSFLPSGEPVTQAERQAGAEESFGFLGEAVEAVPSSAIAFGKNTLSLITSPIQTAKSLKDLSVGLFNKLTPGTQPSEATVDAMVDFFKERYGGVENIKQTIATDPVGVLADVSTIFTLGGTAAATLPGKASTVAKRIAKATEPINVAVAPLKVIAKATPQQFVNKIFQSSAKFTGRLPDIERTNIVNTALNEGIVLSRSGLRKTKRLKKELLNKVDDIIDEGAAAGRGKGVVIKTEDLISQLDDVKDYFSTHPLGVDFVDEIDKFSDKLRRNPKIGVQMTLPQAQQTKKIIGRFIGDNVGKLENASKAAEDAIRRGIKVNLESVFPEIKGLNKKASELIALDKVLEPAIARISNRDLFGLGSKLFASGGLDTGARLFATLSETVLGDPQVKSRLAIAINAAKKKPIVGDDITRLMQARQIAFQAGRIEETVEQSPQTEVQ
jgi:hypothetical protein